MDGTPRFGFDSFNRRPDGLFFAMCIKHVHRCILKKRWNSSWHVQAPDKSSWTDTVYLKGLKIYLL